MRRPSAFSFGLLALVGVLATAGLAQADDHPEKKSPLVGAPSLRHRVELRKMRFELTPQFVISMNQDFKHFIGGGLVLRFHITDWLGVGLSFAGGGGVDTSLTGTIASKLLSENDATVTSRPAFQPTREQFYAHLATVNVLASLFAQATPFSGKLAIFGAGFVRYDLYVMAGVGMMLMSNGWNAYTPNNANNMAGSFTKTTSGCDMPATAPSDINTCPPANDGAKAAFMWGLGLHLFFNDFIALNLEMRDFVASTNYGGLDVNGDRAINGDDNTLTNSFFGSVGVTIMLPPRAKTSR